MAKSASAANRHVLWVFGKPVEFFLVTTTVALQGDYDTSAPNTPVLKQKRQIVLHCTAGVGNAEGVIGWWNNPASGAGSAQFVLERAITAQAARPAVVTPDATQDTPFVDAVRVIDENAIAYHAHEMNESSIGIEMINVAHGWQFTSVGNEPSLGPRPHAAGALCPTTNSLNTCSHRRPRDLNRFIRLAVPISGEADFQAFEDQQYASLNLLLRYLCIRHRIARRFLGDTATEVFKHWFAQGTAAEIAVNRKKIHHFSGILHHRNVHPTKPCPGVPHRNRLYRGLIDEWWLPVQLAGGARPYYSGPFQKPAWNAATPDQANNSLFRWSETSNRLEGVRLRDANIDAFMEAKSYFDFDDIENTYAAVETMRGGHFPIGRNKIWHGGVHFHVEDRDPCVYAAACGTIVAARVSSNPDTDKAPGFGSQRFVLIKHAVCCETESGPGGLGRRINYSVNPLPVFSLYMHLGAVADPQADNDQNPPWFNLWRRSNPAANVGLANGKGRLIFPDIPVSVGDVLGIAGTFHGQRTLHFELFTNRNRELSGTPPNGTPWVRALRVEDADDNAVCDTKAFDQYVADMFKNGLDDADLLRGLRALRGAKTMHKSDWALTSADQLKTAIPNTQERNAAWQHLQRFTWFQEAIAGNAQLANDLGPNGLFWYYHPITFMEFVNRLIEGENREMPPEINRDTNVEVDEQGYIIRFVRWDGASSFVPDNAGNQRITPQYVLTAQRYNFTCLDLTCRGAHPNPQQTTRFAMALLEIVDRIRAHFGQSVTIDLGYVCPAHAAADAAHHPPAAGAAPTASLCFVGTGRSIDNHGSGIAVDIRPAARTNASCLAIWRSANAIVSRFGGSWQHYAGSPTQAEMPPGFDAATVITRPAVAAKLSAAPPHALTQAEINAFSIHIELGKTLGQAVRVTFTSLNVVDDQDFFSSGEWTMRFIVNNLSQQPFTNRSVSTGDTIPLAIPPWTGLVKDLQEVRIHVDGFDEDVFSDDSLGEVDLTFTSASAPAWGVGIHQAKSSNGSFEVTFSIEMVNV